MGDFGRGLTSKGRKQAADTAEFLRGETKKRRVLHVFTSPLVRAVQTAEELAAHLPHVSVSVTEALACGQPARGLVKLADALPADADAIFVGHEPILSELGAELLAESALPFGFEKAACLILREKKKAFSFVAYRAPGGKVRESL